MEIGERLDNPQLMLVAFERMKKSNVAPHPANLRALLLRMSEPAVVFGFRGQLAGVLSFVDAYVDLSSTKNVAALFKALAIAEIAPDCTLKLLQRLLESDFDPEGKLGKAYPFPTSRHYREYEKGNTEMLALDKHEWGVDEHWRLCTLLACGRSARCLKSGMPQQLQFMEKWISIANAYRECLTTPGHFQKATANSESMISGMERSFVEDKIFAVLLSTLIQSDNPFQFLQQGHLLHSPSLSHFFLGYLFRLMKMGLMHGFRPGQKSLQTLHFFTTHTTKLNKRPFKHYRYDRTALLDISQVHNHPISFQTSLCRS